MHREDLIAAIECLANRPGYPASPDFPGDAARLVGFLPDAAFQDTRDGERFDLFEDGDNTSPPQPLTGKIVLQWTYNKPDSYLPDYLGFTTTGHGAFDVAIVAQSRPSDPDIEWQAGVGQNRLSLEAPGAGFLIGLLFAFYLGH
jgi:hypothetical protein